MKKVLFVVCLITCFCFLASSSYAEQSGKNPSLVDALREALPGEFAGLGEFAAAGGGTVVGFPERAKGARLLSSSDITLTKNIVAVGATLSPTPPVPPTPPTPTPPTPTPPKPKPKPKPKPCPWCVCPVEGDCHCR